MKSLVNKLSLFCLLATSAAPMHGNWLTNIGHGISSTFNRAIWHTQVFWYTEVLQCGRSYISDTTIRAAEAGNVSKTKWFAQRATGPCTTPLHLVTGLCITPLHMAIYSGNLRAVKLLIDAGIGINAKNSYVATPLHWAAQLNTHIIAKLLLDKGAVVNAKDSFGETPLHYAAYRGDLKVAQVLISARADVNAKSSGGRTPLHEAAYHCDHATYDLLLKAGALQIKDNEDKTPEDLLKKCTSKK